MSARERFAALPPDAPRDVWFEALREAIAEGYLEEGADEYQQSGRSTGAARWALKRRCIADAIHRDGDFMDVGCANGLLLESLIEWAGEKGHTIRPHGIDFVPELVELARARHPGHGASFETANAFYWEPARTWDFVRLSLEFVPPADYGELTRRVWERAVAPGGRLVLCHYGVDSDDSVDPAEVAAELGLDAAGRSHAPNVEIAWFDKPAER